MHRVLQPYKFVFHEKKTSHKTRVLVSWLLLFFIQFCTASISFSKNIMKLGLRILNLFFLFRPGGWYKRPNKVCGLTHGLHRTYPEFNIKIFDGLIKYLQLTVIAITSSFSSQMIPMHASVHWPVFCSELYQLF